MLQSDAQEVRRDWGGAAAAIACVVLAVYVLWASAAFSVFAAVFPRTIAIVMLVLAGGLLVRVALRKLPRVFAGTTMPQYWRTAALIGTVMMWMVLIKLVGFVAASIVGFVTTGALARFTPWTRKDLLIHIVVSVVAVSAFYVLFAYVLAVRFR